MDIDVSNFMYLLQALNLFVTQIFYMLISSLASYFDVLKLAWIKA
jgi:hypothetical protein